MNSLWFCFFLIGGFVQKEYIPFGIDHGRTGGCVLIADFNRNGKLDFAFATRIDTLGLGLVFVREGVGNYSIVDTIGYYLLIWDTGDFDNDGLYDIVTDGDYFTGIMVFESPDSFSYPTQEVWRDTVGQTAVVPIQAYDVDKDGIPEIFDKNGNGQPHWIWVYESYNNNQYDTVCIFNPITNGSPQGSISTNAFGDFDEDGKVEFVMGDLSAGVLGAEFWIFESPSNNTYEQIFIEYLPTKNIKDCFTVPDADGDGKLEFVVKGFVVPDARTDCFIFEATGNNTYQMIKSFHLPNSMGWDYYGGYSDVGDIDGDTIPEICLESASYVYLIKCGGNDSFYVWQTLPGNNNGSSVRVFDIDGNGLSEIIISGNNYTRIYEKSPFVTWFCPTPYDTFYANDTVYPKWRLDETIALDSLRLYWAHPQLGCHLIYQGLPQDTICQWIVPDTQSHMSNRFWLVTKGFGRYDSTYSPVFYIKRRTGVEENILHSTFRIPHLEVYPNPFKDRLEIRYEIPDTRFEMVNEPISPISYPISVGLKIYDVTGRLLRQWDYRTIRLSDQIIWDGTDDSGQKLPSGVYFVRLETDGFKKNETVILLR